MQKLAIELRIGGSRSPIHPIAHDRMPDEGQMDPNLVRAPGFDRNLEQRGVRKSLDNAEIASPPAVRTAQPPSAAGSSDRGRSARRSSPLLPRRHRRPGRDRSFRPNGLPIARPATCAPVGLRRDDQPRGVLVQAMDDSRPLRSADGDPGNMRDSAFASVPRGCPGAGWTTIPAGLSITMTSSSS